MLFITNRALYRNYDLIKCLASEEKKLREEKDRDVPQWTGSRIPYNEHSSPGRFSTDNSLEYAINSKSYLGELSTWPVVEHPLIILNDKTYF